MTALFLPVEGAWGGCIRAPLERVLCTLIVPSLFGTSYYPLPMYSPEDKFKKPSLRPHFCPRKQGASGFVKGYPWNTILILCFTAYIESQESQDLNLVRNPGD